MICNIDKTVCMVFSPKCRRMIIAKEFPPLSINDIELKYVAQFKYLGHMINNDFIDNGDIKQETLNLFIRRNVLIRRYCKCSVTVKLLLFKAFCMCVYDASIWLHYSITVYNKFKSCYNRCVKMLFGYNRSYSVTLMLSLPCFDNFMAANSKTFGEQWSLCSNNLVSNLHRIQL